MGYVFFWLDKVTILLNQINQVNAFISGNNAAPYELKKAQVYLV